MVLLRRGSHFLISAAIFLQGFPFGKAHARVSHSDFSAKKEPRIRVSSGPVVAESGFSDENEMELEPSDGNEFSPGENNESDESSSAADDLPPAEDISDSELRNSSEGQQDSGGTFDDPDLAYEARLYDIFINYNSEATSPEQWKVIVGNRESEIYPIQKGDNLWEISKTLFSDGYFWPKVWSINSSISNPHLIEPGRKIRFVPGDDSQAPAFNVTEGSKDADESTEPAEDPGKAAEGDKADASPENSENDERDLIKPVLPARVTPKASDNDLDIPPPEKVSRPVIRKFPPSLPDWQNDNVLGVYDSLGISFGRRNDLNLITSLELINYLVEEVPESLGEVKEVESGGLSAVSFQHIYVQVKRGQARVGDKLLIIRNMGPLERPNEFVEKLSFYGHGVEVQGEIALVENVQSKEFSFKTELFRALVIKAVNPIEVGSTLLKGVIERVNLLSVGRRSSIVAQIVGGMASSKRQTFYPQSVAYLNRGSKDGLKVGDILPIRTNRLLRFQKSIVDENTRPSGWLKIAHLTPHFSTAVILRIYEEIFAGDFTGRGKTISGPGGETKSPGTTPEDLSAEALTESDSKDKKK
ncbi:MAG: LysM peptidoglycan-binding domain-containing protein [Bdellovibrionales bacterium]|nr:LysM peptidoglycan-binding domain-containing protein [Bdellovibrionales bacterium]